MVAILYDVAKERECKEDQRLEHSGPHETLMSGSWPVCRKEEEEAIHFLEVIGRLVRRAPGFLLVL
jgi:hypothetical protein